MTEWGIASYLAHSGTTQAAVYTKKVNRVCLANSGFAKLNAANVANLSGELGGKNEKSNYQQYVRSGNGSP